MLAHCFGSSLRRNLLLPVLIATLFLAHLSQINKSNCSAQTAGSAASVQAGEIRLPGGLTEDLVQQGWLALFDGDSLFGWKAESKDVDWRVVEHTIGASKGTPSLLRTTTEFDDYELKVDFLANEKTNSGVFLRTNPNPKNHTSDCYELNIANQPKHTYPTGSITEHKKAEIDYQNDVWRTYHAVVSGNSIKVSVDGELVTEYTTPDRGPHRGFIGLQYRAGTIKFRNVLIRPLGAASIFNGKDLNQWDDSQPMESEFSVTDNGELAVVGGPGQLESKTTWANFLFSMQCKTNAAGLNSGVFFRSIPGEFSNGYESQIQNQFKENDRSQPVDCGTGGIFRRQNARWINATDGHWFTKTIIANGPHISVWVNGYQVTDWTDRRAANANPRKGLRREAGTFILQGHDPTTDLLFRDLKARQLSTRWQ